MPERCVVFGCNNVRSKEKGILLHPNVKQALSLNRICDNFNAL